MEGEVAILPLNRVLRLMADETGTLSDLAARVGNALAAGLDGATATPDLLRDAQALDELQQRIAGLHAYLTCLARDATGVVLLDVIGAASTLTLAAQADRLSGRGERVTAGAEVDLF